MVYPVYVKRDDKFFKCIQKSSPPLVPRDATTRDNKIRRLKKIVQRLSVYTKRAYSTYMLLSGTFIYLFASMLYKSFRLFCSLCGNIISFMRWFPSLCCLFFFLLFGIVSFKFYFIGEHKTEIKCGSTIFKCL